MTSEERRRRRFTETFRREQVTKIEAGDLTISEVCLLYQVRPYSVSKWLKKYGVQALPGPITVISASEVGRVKELEKENENLKKLIGELHIESAYQRGVIRFAKQQLGEDFEKKTRV